MIFFGPTVKMSPKAELPLRYRKVFLAFEPTYLLSYQYTQQGYGLTTPNCSLQLLINFRKGCEVTDITESLSFRNKSNLARDLNAKHFFLE
jgi:hypothetical protein